jgi:CheY-like chemotaxis protein
MPMQHTINLRDLHIVVADQSAFMCKLLFRMLRGFGANRVREASDAGGVLRALSEGRVDMLVCDDKLPPDGGLELTRMIRTNSTNENRTMPILIMTADPRELTIKRARDAGANMVIAKPISPANLYDRLSWIAMSTRLFVETPTYFGPDRRFKIEGYPNGIGRRAGDKNMQIGEETGPALAQDDIDSLFSAARTGQI